jgi:hypothetical protein
VAQYRDGRQGGAGADYAITPASRGVSERVASLRWYDWSSSVATLMLCRSQLSAFPINR